MAEKIRSAELLHPMVLLALGLGVGLAPVAPGTFGTLLAIPLYLFLQTLPDTTQLTVTGLLFLAGSAICDFAADRLGVHDHPAIVFDEVVGYLVTMAFAPAGWQWMVAGFVVFRFFDIVKPWPIRWLDRHVQGGTGIMLDDFVAGLFGALLLYLAGLLL